MQFRSIRPVVALTAVTVISALAFAAGAVTFQTKGESSFTVSKDVEGRQSYTNTTHAYELVQEWWNLPRTLISVKKTVSYMDGADGLQGSIQAKALVDGQGTLDKVAWTVKEDGDDWKLTYEPSFFVTSKAGCCGSLDTYRAYNLKTGQLLMSYTASADMSAYDSSKPFSVNIPNSKLQDRVIGVLSSDATRDFPYSANNTTGVTRVVVITYATADSVLQQLAISVEVPPNYGPGLGNVELVRSVSNSSKNELRNGRITLWDNDGRNDAGAFSGFGLKLTIWAEKEFDVFIPVINDRLEVGAAKYSPGVSFERLK